MYLIINNIIQSVLVKYLDLENLIKIKVYNMYQTAIITIQVVYTHY